jgi:hypothetical protein
MGIFAKWVEQNMGAASPMGAAPTPQPTMPATPVANQPTPDDDPQQNVGDLQLRSMLQRRLEQFLDELSAMKIPKQKAIPLLGTIIQQMQSSFGLSATNVKQAMKFGQ